MAEPFVGEIRMVSFNFAPRGWALCNGQILPINQNQPLFALFGTAFGGDGRTTFALPNLQGRVPVHRGDGIEVGQAGGEASHALTVSELPTHNHAAVGSAGTDNQGDPTNSTWGSHTSDPYSTRAPDVRMNPGAVSAAGGSQPHENRQPHLAVNFIVALQGIFPSRA